MDWISSWVGALTKPKETFAAEKANASLVEGVKQLALVSAIGGIVFALMFLAFAAIFTGITSAFGLTGFFQGFLGGFLSSGIILLVLLPIIMAITSVIITVVYVGIFYLICKVLGGTGSFEQQFYLSTIFLIPLEVLMIALVVAIPLLGILLALLLLLYGIYLAYLVTKEVHGFGVVKFVIALVIYLVVFFILGKIQEILLGHPSKYPSQPPIQHY